MRKSSDLIQFYSPYSFFRNIKTHAHEKIVHKTLTNCEQFDASSSEHSSTVYYKILDWDSHFFGLKTIRIHYIEADKDDPSHLYKILENFEYFCIQEYNCQYMFFEIPSEDILLLQALGLNQFKLIETRLHYYYEKLQRYNYSKRFGVREANLDDISNLRDVSSSMRNNYDRFHADTTFDQNVADKFLAKYIEEAIKGYSDLIIVPNMMNVRSDSFLTGNYCKEDWEDLDVKVSRMVLSAVSSDTNKGWYLKLISEMSYLFKEQGADVAFLTTQSTNRAVYRVWNKLGYQLGAVSHIFAKSFNKHP